MSGSLTHEAAESVMVQSRLMQENDDKNTGWWCNNHLEKYEFVNGKDDIPYNMKWKKMFETTNQNI